LKLLFDEIWLKNIYIGKEKESLQKDNISFRKKINSKFFYIYNEDLSIYDIISLLNEFISLLNKSYFTF